MAATLKICLVLMTITCCQCIPGYRRFGNEENGETPTVSINNQEEPLPDVKVVPVDGSEAIIIEDGLTSDSKDVKAIRKFVQSRLRSQTEHVDSNEEDLHLLTASISPTQEGLDIGTKNNVISQKPPSKRGSNDFSDFIKSFRGFMSNILSANLTHVRVEEMKRDPEKEISNN